MKKWWLPLGIVGLFAALAATTSYWLPAPFHAVAELFDFTAERKDSLAGLHSLVRTGLLGVGAVGALLTYLGLPRIWAERRGAKKYRKYLAERYQYLGFRGMGVVEKIPLKLRLLDMYVPLKARIEMPEGETWARELRIAGRKPDRDEAEVLGERLSGPQPVLDLLREHDGLVVLGDPGSGKTTFLKYLALRLAQGEGKKLGLGRRLPFLVPLSAYAKAIADEDVPLEDFIARYAQGRDMSFSVDSLASSALARGRALILLDGLDEVREEARRILVVQRVQDFYASHRARGNKFVLTSRVVGYREVRFAAERLLECMLVDFGAEEIEAFVGKWTAALERAAAGEGAVAALNAEREKEELLAAIRNHPGVEALAANPLLLTILALMKRQGVSLPERRAELYQRYIETLLKNWNLARNLDGRSGPVPDVLETLKILAPLALWMQEESPGVGLVNENELRARLETIHEERGEEEPEKAARKLLKDVRRHAGLLLDRGGRQFGFIHLTFQEYLAAYALADLAQEGIDDLYDALLDKVGVPEWREVFLLTIGCVGVVGRYDRVASALVEKLLDEPPDPPWVTVAWVGEAVADAGSAGVTAPTHQRVVRDVLDTMRSDEVVPPAGRAAAGVSLARLGDPRFSSDHWHLPDDPLLGFAEIPAGPFLVGSDPEKDKVAYEDEQPQHELELPGFFMGRFPVTVGQWRAFVESSGHEPVHRENLRGVSNHPVAWVTWHEAMAYCEWLEELLGGLAEDRLTAARDESARRFWSGLQRGELRVTLPSEVEWEKAARGLDGRIYPWGAAMDSNKANIGETKLGGPSTVGCFPSGASLYGCEEVLGNLWEWTRSTRGTYPYPTDGTREALVSDDERTFRGGAYFSPEGAVRCAYRHGDLPARLLSWSFGFRVACVPFL